MQYPNRPYRYQTHIPVHVIRPGGPQVAYIVDINEAGACVAGLTGVAVGEAVVLRGSDDANVATVRWAANNRAGVAFDRPIPPKYLNMMRYRDPTMLAAATTDSHPN
ncbi:MAG: hypothetical protein ABJO29_05815 [Yoonia sp.]|uniref:hypothetical protein n=1 Tax=Yoonia sp. TaxID=2212373 RepID=UPI0032977F5D